MAYNISFPGNTKTDDLIMACVEAKPCHTGKVIGLVSSLCQKFL